MRTIICPVCGKQSVDNSNSHNKVCCSPECTRKLRLGKQCQHNEGVWCEFADCSKCGWNPKVAKEREEKIRETICGAAG